MNNAWHFFVARFLWSGGFRYLRPCLLGKGMWGLPSIVCQYRCFFTLLFIFCILPARGEEMQQVPNVNKSIGGQQAERRIHINNLLEWLSLIHI